MFQWSIYSFSTPVNTCWQTVDWYNAWVMISWMTQLVISSQTWTNPATVGILKSWTSIHPSKRHSHWNSHLGLINKLIKKLPISLYSIRDIPYPHACLWTMGGAEQHLHIFFLWYIFFFFFLNYKGSISGRLCNSHIDVSTCSAITCRPLLSSSPWHLLAIFRNNSGYRVSLCNGATNRSRNWSLRHCSFLSHHWRRKERGGERRKKKVRGVKEPFFVGTEG